MASSLALSRAIGSSLLNKLLTPLRSVSPSATPSFTRSFSADTKLITNHNNGDGHDLDVGRGRDTSSVSHSCRDDSFSDVMLKIRVTKWAEKDQPFFENSLPAYTRKIGLPESRVLYTVLRSPHIDKKSREQFKLEIKKELLVIKAQKHELHNKLFWLKRHRIFGAQFEIIVNYKTRLDKEKLRRLL